MADENPEVVAMLKTRMEKFIAKREAETGRPAPIYVNFINDGKPFASSQEAYDSKFIGGIAEAVSLQKK